VAGRLVRPAPGSVEGVDPDLLLTDTALDAAVNALGRRNHHHFSAMSESERAQAVATWRELATDVLVAVRSTLASELPGAEATPVGGRAVIVFEDSGSEDVAVHAAFHPELEEISAEEVAGTPAQLVALSLLEQLNGEPPE
jgi:hypothetical protein